jgi:hypothetical protein
MMKSIYRILLMIIITGVFGCAGQGKHVVTTITTPFDKETAEKQLLPGNNTIKGSALILQAGWGIVTCAGRRVSLIPYSNYAKERMTALYLNEAGGRNILVWDMPGLTPVLGSERDVSNTVPEYYALIKDTICNTQGFFTFSNLADGDYYITSVIT